MSEFNDDAVVSSTGTVTTGSTSTSTGTTTSGSTTTTGTGSSVTIAPLHTETEISESADGAGSGVLTTGSTTTGTTTTGTSVSVDTESASSDDAGAAGTGTISTGSTSTTGTSTTSGAATTTGTAMDMAVTPPSNSAAATHAHADVILDGTVTTNVDLNAQTVNTTVNNFSHTDNVIVSADVLHGIESGQLSVAVTATSVEVDNVATGQSLLHVNLDHTIGTIGVHPLANGAVSVTL